MKKEFTSEFCRIIRRNFISTFIQYDSVTCFSWSIIRCDSLTYSFRRTHTPLLFHNIAFEHAHNLLPLLRLAAIPSINKFISSFPLSFQPFSKNSQISFTLEICSVLLYLVREHNVAAGLSHS